MHRKWAWEGSYTVTKNGFADHPGGAMPRKSSDAGFCWKRSAKVRSVGCPAVPLTGGEAESIVRRVAGERQNGLAG
jgi:hypothetical protein